MSSIDASSMLNLAGCAETRAGASKRNDAANASRRSIGLPPLQRERAFMRPRPCAKSAGMVQHPRIPQAELSGKVHTLALEHVHRRWRPQEGHQSTGGCRVLRFGADAGRIWDLLLQLG